VIADPYSVLGVKKDSSQEEIQKAYRSLAKKLHPDLNPGNKKAEEQFKEVTAAYDIFCLRSFVARAAATCAWAARTSTTVSSSISSMRSMALPAR
jgi:preprotein translocase subunit Sec63